MTQGTRTIYEGRMVTLRIEQRQGRDGKIQEREVVEHAAGAAVLALNEQGEVLLVRQPRPAVSCDLLELPAGIVDQGEDPSECARRELEEETGYIAGRVELLARFYPSPGFCTEELFVYLAENLTEGRTNHDPEEEIEIVPTPIETLVQQIARGEVLDASTIVGVLTYLRRRSAKGAPSPTSLP